MPDRFWRGGTATWDATAGSKWAATVAGPTGAAVPTAADDVYFDATSGSVTVTTSGTTTCVARSVNFADSAAGPVPVGFVFNHAASTTVVIGTTTANAAAKALTLHANVTYTLGSTTTSAYSFVSTSATQQTVESAGKTLANITFGSASVSGSYSLTSSTNTFTSSGTIAQSSGTLSFGVANLSAAILSWSGSPTKTFTPGSTAISLSSTSAGLNYQSNSGLVTVSANTAVITLTGATTPIGGNANWNGASIVMNYAGASITFTNPGTWANFTRTGTAVTTDALSISGSLTVTGTLTLAGNSATNRLLVQSGTVGTAATISAATVSCSNVDFMDITAAGAGNWDLSAITGGSGDCQGNSGITFTVAAGTSNGGNGVKRYAVASGSWTSTSMWSTTSGGSPGASVPLPQDDVYFNADSAAGTYTTVAGTRICRNLDMTGFTRTFNRSGAHTVYGSYTLSASATYTTGSAPTVTFRGRGNNTITTAGKPWATSNVNPMIIEAPGGTYTLADDFSGSGTLQHLAGTLNTAGFNVTCDLAFISSGTQTRTLNVTNSTITAKTTTPFSFTSTGMTFVGTNAVFVIGSASTSTRTFAGGGLTFDTLRYAVAKSPGQLTISGNNTFTNLNIGPGRTLANTANATQTVNGELPSGSPFGFQRLSGVSGSYISAPSTNVPVGDMDIRIRVNKPSWLSDGTFVARYGAAGQRSFIWSIENSRMYFYGSVDGTTTTIALPFFTSPFVDGTTYWLRMTRTKSTGIQSYSWAPDSTSMPTSWTPLVDSGAVRAGNDLFTTASLLEIGSNSVGTAGLLAGDLYRVQIRNNILDDGTGIVFDADFTTKPFGDDSFTESSSNASTVTITGAAATVGDGRIAYTSTTGGTVASFDRTVGAPFEVSYATLKDIRSTRPYGLYATNSVDLGNNPNVGFGAKPNLPYLNQRGFAATATSPASITATLPQAAAAGSLLVAEAAAANLGTPTFTAGWTAATPSNNGTTTQARVFYKVATGGETSFTLTPGASSGNTNLSIREIAGWSGIPAFEVADRNTTAGSTTSLSTTATTGPINTPPGYAVVLFSYNSTSGVTVSWTNDYQEDYANTSMTTVWASAAKPLSAAAAQSTTRTWTSGRSSASNLLVFQDVVSGAFLAFM